MCTPDSQSSVKENKLNIFKMDKNEKKKKLFNVKKHCADNVELPECSDTRHEEQKVSVKCSRKTSVLYYVGILLNVTNHGPFQRRRTSIMS